MTVYGYARVSTERQAEDGESLGQQDRAVRAYATLQDLEVDDVLVERGVSGSMPFAQRPQGGRLLRLVGPGDVIIVTKLDRAFRSALDALHVCDQLRDAGASLHMIDLGGDVIGGGVSRLVFTILSAVAEAERDRIRERVRDVKQDQRRRNRYLGGRVPFGWRRDGDGALVPDPTASAIIAEVVEMTDAGMSTRELARRLQGRGVNISHNTVARIARGEVEPPA